MQSNTQTQSRFNVLDVWRHADDLYWRRSNWSEKGDTITWEYGGLVKTGKIVKMNRKTVEVVDAGALLLTFTKIQSNDYWS